MRHRLAAFAITCALGAVGPACRTRTQDLGTGASDAFDRAEIGPDWNVTGDGYRITDGALNVSGAYNHPLWLRRRLPENVVIDVDAWSKSPAGDIKVELFGDGESFDPDRGGYVSTGYMLIFGGWHNSLSVICRNNEHDDGRKSGRQSPRVEMNRRYHFSITRKIDQTGAGKIDWLVDGQPFLSWTDPQPLRGAGHDFFAFNNWEADVYFDNLSIRPLGT